MKKITSIIGALLIGLVSFPVLAGDVTVKWQEPAKFADIDPAEQNKDQFEANLFRDFDRIFSDLAQRLPGNYRLHITVTDLDLAGEVRQIAGAGARRMREVKPVYPPAINFDYQLFDAQNDLVKQDKVALRDLNFMSRPRSLTGVNSKSFPYEQYMITQWFDRQQNDRSFPSR